jgi:hypothetical protein
MNRTQIQSAIDQQVKPAAPSAETRALRMALEQRNAYANQCIDLAVELEMVRENLAARENELVELRMRFSGLEVRINEIEQKEAADGTRDTGQQAGSEQPGLRPDGGGSAELDHAADAWRHAGDVGDGAVGPDGSGQGPH